MKYRFYIIVTIKLTSSNIVSPFKHIKYMHSYPEAPTNAPGCAIPAIPIH